MYINRLRLKNFKKYADFEIEFTNQFTVLFGQNASGKTSILDGLAIAAGSFFLGINNIDSVSIKDGEVKQVFIEKQPKPQYPVEIEAWGNVNGKQINWLRDNIGGKIRNKGANEIKKLASVILAKSRDENTYKEVQFPVIVYYSTDRNGIPFEKVKLEEGKYLMAEEGVMLAYTNCLQ